MPTPVDFSHNLLSALGAVGGSDGTITVLKTAVYSGESTEVARARIDPGFNMVIDYLELNLAHGSSGSSGNDDYHYNWEIRYSGESGWTEILYNDTRLNKSSASASTWDDSFKLGKNDWLVIDAPGKDLPADVRMNLKYYQGTIDGYFWSLADMGEVRGVGYART